MKKVYTIFTLLMGFSTSIFAQSKPQDLAVELKADYQTSPKFAIVISWVPDSNCTGYYVYRKTRDKDTWGSYVKSLKKNEFVYSDTGVVQGNRYEYFVRKNFAGGLYGCGYIEAGYQIPQTDFRGGLIVAIEKGLKDSLASEISMMLEDFVGDGWKVHPIYIDKTLKPAQVKDLLKDIYSNNKGIKSIYLFGRIPVPYSGNIVPDAHRPDHEGAWPADGYYGDMDLDWEDAGVNVTKASRAANHNVPGDDKFDDSVFPTDLELSVGRTDMNGMTLYGATEYELLRKYFEKNHAYRHKMFTPVYRAIIDDNFGYMGGEAFSGNAYRNFSVLLGAGKYRSADYFGTLKDSILIWSYGCGGGSYTSASGIGNSQAFADSNIQGVFTNLFGSYFGDWDINNNFLRAPLASPKSKVLVNAWVGRPWWVFHHMGLGEPVGYSTTATQNGTNLYGNPYNFAAGYVSVCLMGDPTLRMHMNAPASAVTLSKYDNDTRVKISWTASPDVVDGYHVYRADSLFGDFVRITGNPVTSTTFNDPWPNKGNNVYMVRAYKNEITNSGVFGNLSQGAFASIKMDTVQINSVGQIPDVESVSIFPNPAHDYIQINVTHQGQYAADLYNVTGQLLRHQISIGNSQLSLNGITPGIYWLKVSQNDQVKSVKVLVN